MKNLSTKVKDVSCFDLIRGSGLITACRTSEVMGWITSSCFSCSYSERRYVSCWYRRRVAAAMLSDIRAAHTFTGKFVDLLAFAPFFVAMICVVAIDKYMLPDSLLISFSVDAEM